MPEKFLWSKRDGHFSVMSCAAGLISSPLWVSAMFFRRVIAGVRGRHLHHFPGSSGRKARYLRSRGDWLRIRRWRWTRRTLSFTWIISRSADLLAQAD